DGQTIVSLIRGNPELHGFVGRSGTLVEIIDREAPELLEAALAAGLCPDGEPEPTCQTLLQKAACEGDLERVRLFLRYGADPQKRNDIGELALGYACSWGQLGAVKLLVEAGAEVNAVEEDPTSGRRNTPLDCAHRSPEIVEYLRSRGAVRLEELDA
ncbi:MAG: ankyrin repeat domain-containing protein, partial [Actinomycetota bacterium]